MQSPISKSSKLSTTHQAISSFFDDADEVTASVEYLGHEPESYMFVSFPGAGKTTLAMTFPDAYILNFDRKGGAITKEAKVKTFKSGEDVYTKTINILDALSDLETRKELEVKTVVIDTITALSELMEIFIVGSKEYNPKGTKGLQIQHYSQVQHQIVEVIRRCYETQLDVIITAHPDEIQNEEGELVYHPAVTGKKAGPKLGGKFDNVIWLERNENGFISTLKGTSKFPHAKLSMSPFAYKEAPERVADLTYRKLSAIKIGKAKKKK